MKRRVLQGGACQGDQFDGDKMAFSDPMTMFFVAGISLLAASVAVGFGLLLYRRDRDTAHIVLRGVDLPCTYAFRDGYLVSDRSETDPFLPDPVDRVAAWGDLRDTLAALNHDVGPGMDALRARGDSFLVICRIGDDDLSISGRFDQGHCTLSIAAATPDSGRRLMDIAGLDAMTEELDLLRHALDFDDVALWREDDAGQIVWANKAYFDLLARSGSGDESMVWPIRRIFDIADGPTPAAGETRRVSMEMPGHADPLWFERAVLSYRQGSLHAARPIDRLVAAETSLRDFVQTLSRTFAQLPIGLAIFDQRRELVLFNPALVTISTLPFDWLSSRPDLFAFLDGLREHQRMPEPKDYKEWRAEIAALEQAARDGTYQELWTLPNGQSLRVVGRPHADGAVAFLFEDISQEVTLTRKFRGDLDLYQAVMDDTPEALAVFAKDGQLVMSNAAYTAMWPEAAGAGVHDATRHWQADCTPTPFWGAVREIVAGHGDWQAGTTPIRTRDGRGLVCRVAPLRGGATLVGFLPEVTAVPVPDPEMQAAGGAGCERMVAAP